MSSWGLLLAQGAPDTQVFHQFARLQAMTEWWQWFVLGLICLALGAFVVVMYRKDSVELSRGVAWGLCLLRCVAFLGILFFFLDLEKREERKLVRNSRAVVLVDTSLSMGIQDGDASVGSGSGGARRIDVVIQEFAQRQMLARLREQHDVVVYRFDQQTAPIELASFPRIARASDENPVDRSAVLAAGTREARRIAWAGGVLVGISILAGAVFLLFGRQQPARRGVAQAVVDRDGSWALLVSMATLIAGLIVVGVACLRHPELEFGAILGLSEPQLTNMAATSAAGAGATSASSPTLAVTDVKWSEELAPRGIETRLGDAVRFLLNKERGGSIAGLVVLTDGGNNAGADLGEVVATARATGIPVYAIGLGSDRRPTNVRIVDLEAPPRVFPGDAFPITGFLQAFNQAGRSVKVELISTPGKLEDPQAERTLEDSRQITLGRDGELQPLKFEVTPKQAGQRTYQLKVTPATQDADERDNARAATVQVVDRETKVLLFASAATREFQFLRNLLYRDKATKVDVLLQSGSPGISQEADELLYEFPKLADELFAYDSIVALDADWTKLDELQAQLLERWVAEKAGGLVLVAGTVETPKLMSSRAGDARLETIRGLFPVVFFSRGSATLSISRNSGETPWPLEFTRDGQEAEFLRLADDPRESEEAWASYPGVFGCFAVKDPKPGAKVLARFSDPAAAMDGESPVYMASQFYGAGRVVYLGSGEMWRLRQASDAYFERFYTKLLRWTGQGRLLRDSNRGVLLVDKERCLLGDTVTVQGILNDSQHQPLTVGEVTAVLARPDGLRSNLTLRRIEDAARPGMYSAQFTTALEGDYRIELNLPNSSADELLVREVRARIPALETERPERNDPWLKELAEKTGGEYFIGLAPAVEQGSGRTPLPTLLEPQDQTTLLPGTPDKEFDRILMTWLLVVIAGALSLEWLLRRLHKLA